MIKIRKRKGLGFDAIFMAISRVVTMLVGIVTTRILSSQLSLADYGTYAEALTIISVVTSISIFGLIDSEVYFFNSEKDRQQRQRVVNTIFLIELVLSLMAALVVIALTTTIVNYFSNPKLLPLIAIVAFEPLIDNFFNLVTTLYIAEGRSSALAIRNAITSIIKLGIVCVGIFVFKNVYWILLLTFSVNAIQLAIFWVWYRKIGFFINPFKCDPKKVKTILSFAFPVSLLVLTNALLKQCDKMVLGNLVTVEDIAVFENASKQLPFDIIVSAMVTVAVPFLSKFILNKDKANLEKLLFLFNSISLISLLIFAFPALLSSQEMIRFLYGAKFLSGNNIFIIYTIIEIVKFSNVSIVLVTCNKKTELVLVSLSALILNIGLDRLMHFEYGMVGCAIATLIVTVLIQIYLIIRTISLTGVRFFKIIDIKRVIYVLIQCAILAIASFFLKIFYTYIGVKNDIVMVLLCYGMPFFALLALNAKYLLNIYRDLNSVSKEE